MSTERTYGIIVVYMAGLGEVLGLSDVASKIMDANIFLYLGRSF